MKNTIIYFILFLIMVGITSASTSITLNNPTSGTWLSSATINFNYTVSGGEVGYNCSIYAHNKTGQVWSLLNTQTIASGTRAGYTEITGLNDTNIAQTSYKWQVNCKNNVTGVYPEDSANTTFYIATAPSNTANISCLGTIYANDSVRKWTDYTPTFYWTNWTGYPSAFSKYTIYVSNESDFSPATYTADITTKETTYSEATLRSLISKSAVNDDQFYWYVNVTNQAGLQSTATNCTISSPYNYRTDETCAKLYTGWNVCAVDYNSNGKNVTNIWNEIGLSSSTDVIARWNVNTQTFISYTGSGAGFVVNGSLGNVDNSQETKSVVLIYTASDVYWENRSTSTTVALDIAEEHQLWNLTYGYNFVPVYNTTTFIMNDVDTMLNDTQTNISVTNGIKGNISYISWWNNSGKQYVSSFREWGVNNATRLPHYEVYVVYLEQAGQVKVNRTERQ